LEEDFFAHYLDYTSGGEAPPTFHRWSAIASIAAILERQVWFTYGHNNIFPNIYTMLIGTAGTRKSTAIKLAKKLLRQAGYTTIAAERTSKEKYFADLAAQHSPADDDILSENIFGPAEDADAVTNSLIAADEANDFFGVSNIDFLSILGSLWDWEGKYENKVKTGKSDFIPNPTITILSGNTPTGFAIAFPSTIFGQGFFSRLLLVYSEPTGDRITFPRTPSKEATAETVKLLQTIKQYSVGERKYSHTGREFVDKIYQHHKVIDDPRFDSFSQRRLTHLIKLTLIVSAARMEREISERSVLQANTYLTYVENLMPKALGEFGKARNAEVSHKIITILESANTPVTTKQLFSKIKNDLEDPKDLGAILQKLLFADQIQTVGALGFLPKKREMNDDPEKLGLVAFNEFLTPAELGVTR
jgi:hypothetical protein